MQEREVQGLCVLRFSVVFDKYKANIEGLWDGWEGDQCSWQRLESVFMKRRTTANSERE